MATFHKIKISAPFALLSPTSGDLLTGQPNPFYGLVTYLNDAVPNNKRYTNDGITYVWNAEVILEMFTLDLLKFLASIGCEIESLPLFFEIDPTDDVPERLQPTDEKGDLVVISWADWFATQPTRTLSAIGDAFYVPTSVFDGQDYLPLSHALLLGVDLLTKPQIDELINADIPTE